MDHTEFFIYYKMKVYKTQFHIVYESFNLICKKNMGKKDKLTKRQLFLFFFLNNILHNILKIYNDM